MLCGALLHPRVSNFEFEMNMSKAFDVRIGINPIGWSNDDLPALGGETPLETALSEGKEIGYEGFELGRQRSRRSSVNTV